MPYSIEERDGKWCVIRTADDKVMGSHPTQAHAIEQIRDIMLKESGRGKS